MATWPRLCRACYAKGSFVEVEGRTHLCPVCGWRAEALGVNLTEFVPRVVLSHPG